MQPDTTRQFNAAIGIIAQITTALKRWRTKRSRVLPIIGHQRVIAEHDKLYGGRL